MGKLGKIRLDARVGRASDVAGVNLNCQRAGHSPGGGYSCQSEFPIVGILPRGKWAFNIKNCASRLGNKSKSN
jgi:hypothetical protein